VTGTVGGAALLVLLVAMLLLLLLLLHPQMDVCSSSTSIRF
jgi:hypothetical protein